MAYKFVRARIEGQQKTHGAAAIRMISVGSPKNDEGKTITACNLAICLAQTGKRVVLVDCDFRKPSVHAYFRYHKRLGIVDLFTKNVTLEEVVIHDVNTPTLDILPAGTGVVTPSELVSSEKFVLLIEFLRESYDFVVVDGPPVNSVVDAALLASLADLPILVSRYRKTSKAALLSAHRKIAQIAPKAVYGVINGVPSLDNVLTYYAYPYYFAGPGGRSHQSIASNESSDLNDFEQRLKQKKESKPSGT